MIWRLQHFSVYYPLFQDLKKNMSVSGSLSESRVTVNLQVRTKQEVLFSCSA